MNLSIADPVPGKLSRRRASADSAPALDLSCYAPALFTFIASRLSRGAAQHYQSICGIGIETWRILVLLKVYRVLSATKISTELGMDKGSISRCLKNMQASGLVKVALDEQDGRVRNVHITAKAEKVHDQIVGVALERERAFLSVLSPDEQTTLIDLLGRLHANLPAVESATQDFVRLKFPSAKSGKASL